MESCGWADHQHNSNPITDIHVSGHRLIHPRQGTGESHHFGDTPEAFVDELVTMLEDDLDSLKAKNKPKAGLRSTWSATGH